jgi:hypothetical protein
LLPFDYLIKRLAFICTNRIIVMHKIILIVSSIFLLCACKGNTNIRSGKKENTALNKDGDSLIQRIVCFKFKKEATPAAIQQHIRGFATLRDSIPYILSYQAGPTIMGDLNEEPEYDVMHYTTYHSEEEIRLYAVHPVHLRFIEQNKLIWEKVLVINSRIYPQGK